jgi:hypothetical protein
MNADPASAEQAVRQYLSWLSNPDLLRDEARISDLRTKADGESDPIAKLKIFTELERASAVDAEGVKLAFIHHAKSWADANDVTAGAFRALGVDEVMLAAAGLVAGGRKRNRRDGAGNTRRAANVSAIVIKQKVSTLPEPFTLSDLMSDIGGSPATVRKAVEEMIAEGTVVKLGPIAHHAARGRAPIEYRRVVG